MVLLGLRSLVAIAAAPARAPIAGTRVARAEAAVDLVQPRRGRGRRTDEGTLSQEDLERIQESYNLSYALLVFAVELKKAAPVDTGALRSSISSDGQAIHMLDYGQWTHGGIDGWIARAAGRTRLPEGLSDIDLVSFVRFDISSS